MMHKMLVLLSHEYPPYIFGGVATFSKQVTEWFSERGWRVIAIVGKASIRERVSISRVSDRLTVVRLYFPEIPPRWLLYTRIARSYVGRLVEKGCRIILSNSPLTSGLVIPKSVKNKLHVITFFHGSIYSLLSLIHYTPLTDYTMLSPYELAYYSEVPLINYLTKRDLLLSDLYIFMARHIMEEFKSIYTDLVENIQSKGIVVYPGIEYSRLISLRTSTEKVSTGKIIVAFVGRLYYTKGVVHAIRAVEALAHELNVKDVELWIFGKGPLEYWIRYYVRKRESLRGKVKLFGFVERAKLLTLLAKYVDVLIHPSLYEGAPLAIMEAQALGIPVVAFNLPWTWEFILDNINGYKKPYPYIEKLADGVIRAFRLRNKVPLDLAKKYDRSKIFTKLTKLELENI